MEYKHNLQPTGPTGTGKQTGGRYPKGKAAENSTQKVRKVKHNPRNRGNLLFCGFADAGYDNKLPGKGAR